MYVKGILIPNFNPLSLSFSDHSPRNSGYFESNHHGLLTFDHVKSTNPIVNTEIPTGESLMFERKRTQTIDEIDYKPSNEINTNADKTIVDSSIPHRDSNDFVDTTISNGKYTPDYNSMVSEEENYGTEEHFTELSFPPKKDVNNNGEIFSPMGNEETHEEELDEFPNYNSLSFKRESQLSDDIFYDNPTIDFHEETLDFTSEKEAERRRKRSSHQHGKYDNHRLSYGPDFPCEKELERQRKLSNLEYGNYDCLVSFVFLTPL